MSKKNASMISAHMTPGVTAQEMQRRRAVVRSLAIATRAALDEYRAVITQSFEASQARLEQVLAWADGGQLPSCFDAYHDAVDRLDRPHECVCGECDACQLRSTWDDIIGATVLEDGVSDALQVIRDGELHRSADEYIHEKIVEMGLNNAPAQMVYDAALNALVKDREATRARMRAARRAA